MKTQNQFQIETNQKRVINSSQRRKITNTFGKLILICIISGYWNIGWGQCPSNCNTGSENIFLGGNAGNLITTGGQNTFLGYDAGHSNTTGNINTFVGSSAGNSNTSGSENIFVGRNTGRTNTTGSNNTFLGAHAGYSNITGIGNVFLGYQAGHNETGSNRLYIENSNSATPLIWGDFQNDILNFNANVGIGTNSPSHKLSVLGVTSSNGIRIPGRYAFGQSESAIEMEVASGDYNAIRAYNGNQNIGTIHFFDDTWGSGLPANSAGSINIDGAVATTIGSWNNPVAYFRKSDGNVGIGTATPSERFQVHTAGGADNTFTIRSDENVGMELRSGSTEGTPYIDFSNDALTDYDMRLILHGDNGLSIEGGNVGIGTATPDAKLAVNGDIHAQEVRVDMTGWPDYVFAEDYTLRSLDTVEKYIKENKHLPEIPNETEVKEKGVNLGDMNAKLLQKIEELTLYMIELNKKVEILTKENKALKAEIRK